MVRELKKILNVREERTIMDADYANFNIQHTPKAMGLVFKAFQHFGERLGATSDWLWCVKWVLAATQVRSFNFAGCLGHDGRRFRAVQSMFSGTRATDIYNTILNRASSGVALKVLEAQFGIIPRKIYHVHQGDDIHTSCENVDAAVGVWLVLRFMGLDMQRHKQLLGAGCAEFLRIVFTNDRGFGIPARALINLILEPLQSSDGDDPIETIPATCDTVQVLRRRGLSLLSS